MLEERIRLIYLSRDKSDIKQISLSGRKFYITLAGAVLAFTAIIVLGVGLFNKLYTDYRIVRLQNDKEFLQNQLLSFKEKTASIESQLADVQEISDKLRKTAGINPVSSDMRKLGVGGPGFYGSPEIGYYSEEIIKTSVEIENDLDKFIRDIQFERGSLNAVAQKLKEQSNFVNCSPSIMPILGGTIISNFGYRTDPFTKKRSFHPGIDIPAPRGTQVLATADGRISHIDNVDDSNYGKWIEIDHGYGFKTRYAHLSKINVKVGQRVKRWEVIGLVGMTGRAEGYHLHYEVLQQNTKVNPVVYVFNSDGI